MIHPLQGRRQTSEHIAKRVASYKSHPRRLRDMGVRLLSKIKKIGECWVWTGSKFVPNGYGQIRVGRRGNNRLMRAHRISYEYFVGEIGEGLEIDHLCRNRLCINPKHLEPVTHLENMKRRFSITN